MPNKPLGCVLPLFFSTHLPLFPHVCFSNCYISFTKVFFIGKLFSKIILIHFLSFG
jgi:hypothetical protein